MDLAGAGHATKVIHIDSCGYRESALDFHCLLHHHHRHHGRRSRRRRRGKYRTPTREPIEWARLSPVVVGCKSSRVDLLSEWVRAGDDQQAGRERVRETERVLTQDNRISVCSHFDSNPISPPARLLSDFIIKLNAGQLALAVTQTLTHANEIGYKQWRRFFGFP